MKGINMNINKMTIDEAIENLKDITVRFPYKNEDGLCDILLDTKDIKAIYIAIESLIIQKRLAEYRDFDVCEWQEDYDWDENNISEYQSVASVNDFLIDELKGEEYED